jgi:hypothetical protein
VILDRLPRRTVALCAAGVLAAACAAAPGHVARSPGSLTVTWPGAPAGSTAIIRADCLVDQSGAVLLVESRDLVRRPEGRIGIGVDLTAGPTALVMHPDSGRDGRSVIPAASLGSLDARRTVGRVALVRGDDGSYPAEISWRCPGGAGSLRGASATDR